MLQNNICMHKVYGQGVVYLHLKLFVLMHWDRCTLNMHPPHCRSNVWETDRHWACGLIQTVWLFRQFEEWFRLSRNFMCYICCQQCRWFFVCVFVLCNGSDCDIFIFYLPSGGIVPAYYAYSTLLCAACVCIHMLQGMCSSCIAYADLYMYLPPLNTLWCLSFG